MSRIGKKSIPIPDKVQVTVDGTRVVVEGPKGKLERCLHPEVEVLVENKELVIRRKNDGRIARSMHGLSRTLVENMVKGVVQPFKTSLEITGVGYRAELLGQTLKMQLGFSHDVVVPLPSGVECAIEKQTLVHLSCADKEVVGQLAAMLRAYRPCEPYKGKGVKYSGEKIRRKEGKTGAS